jgi:SAM-dependent methyltransferase
VFPWDHNAYYHRLLLRHVPSPCPRALDVGCGTGVFAARLARQAERVDAVDRSAEMVEEARRRAPANMTCVRADVLTDPLPGQDYDAILSISALHHMPLPEVLPVLAAALRPGGVLAAIALPRRDLLREGPVEFVASVVHHVLGVGFLAMRLLGRPSPYAKNPANARMPVVMNPPLTTREAARQAAAVLPGARVRRLLFWRYLLVWQKPGTPQADETAARDAQLTGTAAAARGEHSTAREPAHDASTSGP